MIEKSNRNDQYEIVDKLFLALCLWDAVHSPYLLFLGKREASGCFEVEDSGDIIHIGAQSLEHKSSIDSFTSKYGKYLRIEYGAAYVTGFEESINSNLDMIAQKLGKYYDKKIAELNDGDVEQSEDSNGDKKISKKDSLRSESKFGGGFGGNISRASRPTKKKNSLLKSEDAKKIIGSNNVYDFVYEKVYGYKRRTSQSSFT